MMSLLLYKCDFWVTTQPVQKCFKPGGWLYVSLIENDPISHPTYYLSEHFLN